MSDITTDLVELMQYMQETQCSSKLVGGQQSKYLKWL